MNHSQSGHDVALLYRPSVRILSEHESSVMMYHGYARLVISHPSLGRMAVIMTHLHPTSQLFRQGEAENVVSKATFETNAIVMGDFNTIAPDEAPVEELTPNARARLLLPDGTPNSAPVRAFLDRGFVDLGAKRKSPTYPTALGGKSHRLGTRLRVDYMFASAAVATRADCSTIASALAEETSDHLPLKCELGD
jgi:endonuclease/exonuclease/phosphatase family metal-dependent hydrolase